MADVKQKKPAPKIITLASGARIKAGSALDTSSGEGKKRIAAKRVRTALKKVTGGLKTRVIASQKESVGRGGVQRQANAKTGDKGELSVQKSTASPKSDALNNEPTNRGLRRAIDNAAQSRADAKKKLKSKGT